jgi:cold shock CspA family protein
MPAFAVVALPVEPGESDALLARLAKWRWAHLATGRVLQFDQERGYGFIGADDGGEDVFLHASVLDGESYDLSPGVRIEFKVMAEDRGRKAPSCCWPTLRT